MPSSRSQWLVEQQDCWLVDDCPCQRDALLLAARKFMNLALAIASEPNHGECLVGPEMDVACGKPRPCLAQPVADVFFDIQVGEKSVVLEHHIDWTPIGLNACHIGATDQHLALARLLEAADHPQAGRLAASGWAKKGYESSRRHRKVNTAYCRHAAVAFGHIAKLDIRNRRCNQWAISGQHLLFEG